MMSAENDLIDRLRAESAALKTQLLKLQYDSDTETCPVCGGYRHHDGACELAALLYPEYAESYEEQTGMSVIAAMRFDAENSTIKNEPKIFDEATCEHCGHPVQYGGANWHHTNNKGRRVDLDHPAEPSK